MLKPLLNVEEAPPSCVSAPVFEIAKSVVVEFEVELAISNALRSVLPLFSEIAKRAAGEVVPIPIVPEFGSAHPVVVAGSEPKMMLPMLIWLLAVLLGKYVL